MRKPLSESRETGDATDNNISETDVLSQTSEEPALFIAEIFIQFPFWKQQGLFGGRGLYKDDLISERDLIAVSSVRLLFRISISNKMANPGHTLSPIFDGKRSPFPSCDEIILIKK